MNPFECDNEVSNNIEPTIVNITIWKEKRGRKTNTYLTGWNLEEDELKGYIKDFKKKKGCNGSLKEDEETGGFKLHFQGDKVDDVIEYHKTKGIIDDNITLKGQ